MTSACDFQFGFQGVLKILLLASWMLTVDPKLSLRPKIFGRTIPDRELNTRYAKTQKKIVLIHNFYRAEVDPPASNMLEMTWHQGAQEAAQKWADACEMLTHDNPLDRWTQDYGSCGQNIFVSSAQVDWLFVAKVWYMEHKNFTFGSTKNNLADVGHYTQMVWYNSHRIGCGFRFCGKDVVRKPFFNYVCNYCPIGNDPRRLGKPYAAGKPCDKCPKYCKYKKLCTNSCPYANLWVNCADLNTTWNKWLCADDSNERFKACRATCKCPNAIK